MPSSTDAIVKYTTSDRASTIVVINGLAITAGSSLHFLASNGSVQPINLAITIAINNTKETTNASVIDILL